MKVFEIAKYETPAHSHELMARSIVNNTLSVPRIQVRFLSGDGNLVVVSVLGEDDRLSDPQIVLYYIGRHVGLSCRLLRDLTLPPLGPSKFSSLVFLEFEQSVILVSILAFPYRSTVPLQSPPRSSGPIDSCESLFSRP